MNDENLNRVAQRLFDLYMKKVRRASDGVGVNDMARRIGVATGTVKGWMRGVRPDYDRCEAIANFLGWSVHEVRREVGYCVEEPLEAPNLSADEKTLLDAYKAHSVARLQPPLTAISAYGCGTARRQRQTASGLACLAP